MCWSGEASAVLAIAGFTMTAYLIKTGEKKELWITLFYFTLMELLQAVTYIYINQCHLPMNKILTILGYTHIAFQPFFVNMAAMYFIPKDVKQKISPYVYGLCCIVPLLYALKFYPLSDASLCHVGKEIICGPFICSYKGNWHIAWQLPLNGLNFGFIGGLHEFGSYGICAFVLPVLYGSWRVILVTFLLGPLIAYFSTNNVNEFPAIWCLYSIALCCTIIKTPLRHYLFVDHWFMYRFFGVREGKSRRSSRRVGKA